MKCDATLKKWMRRWAMSWKWLCAQRGYEKKNLKEYDKLCLKICPYKCRRQPLIGNRIAANFGNKDSSNKDKKPALFCNVNMVAK